MDFYDFLLPDESITSAVTGACSFFNMNEAPVISSEGVCVWSNNTQTTLDDIFGVNKEQLSDMGLLSHDSITLAYTHECAHRALQDYDQFSQKEEELACDFLAGFHAQMIGLDDSQFDDALHNTVESETHPSGDFRHESIQFGKQLATEFQNQGITPTLDLCIERFSDFLEDLQSSNQQNDFPQSDQSEISFGSAYTQSQYIEKAENCYKEADKYYDKAMRDEKLSDKEHDLAQAEKWRQRGDEYMSKSKYADKDK